MSEQTNKNEGFLKEKLANYQADPPEKVWNAISAEIGSGRKRRGMYILLLATAASMALAISLGLHFFGPDLPGDHPTVMEQGLEEEASERATQGTSIGEREEAGEGAREGQTDDLSPEKAHERQQETKAIMAMQERDLNEAQVPEIPEPEPEAVRNAEAIETAGLIEFEAVLDEESVSDPVPDLQPDTSLQMITDPFPGLEQEKKKSRWMVGAAVSPLYSYRDAEAVAIPSNQAESGLLSYSTGVHVRYRRNSRLAFETGIYYNRTGIAIGAPGIRVFSQSRDNLIFGVGSESADINGVSNSVGNIVAYSGDIYINGYKITAESGIDDFQGEVMEDVQVAESGIQQHLDYLELPFNLRYSVIDRTIELQLVGGLSTNFLVGNSVTVEGSSGKEEIGYLSNVNAVNYSGNAGLGMIYHMGKKVSLILEPRFRYFINSVNDATLPATRPYSLGLYTGLSYTF